MSLNIFKGSLNEIEYIEDAINNVKGEEDLCCFDEEAIKKFLYNDDNWFYIATMDNKAVAYVIAYVQRRLDTTRNMICLYEIGTLRCCREKGIAKRMISKIIEDGKLNNVMKIWIPTNTSNIPACELYRSIGAEETGLNSKSVDLITVAQAFHWFDKEKCLLEFKRIIKDNGKVFIVWDDFIGDYNDFSIEQGKVVSQFRAVEPENKGRKITRAEMINKFFKNNKFRTMVFTHELYEEFDKFKGGILSASFTPKPGEENYEPFINKLQEVFDKYQQNGKVCTAFRSECYFGEL